MKTTLSDDNLYPNDGAFMHEPEEQVLDKQKERGELLEALPLVQDIIKRFKDRIKFYDSVASIPDEVKTKPDEFMHVVQGNEIAKHDLIAEREWLEDLLDRHFKR